MSPSMHHGEEPNANKADVHWLPLTGDFEVQPDSLRFHGTSVAVPLPDGSERLVAAVGTALTPIAFSGGDMEATIRFSEISEWSAAKLIVYDAAMGAPTEGAWVGAGLGAKALAGVAIWTGKALEFPAGVGAYTNLRAGVPYRLRVSIRGSLVTVNIDGVSVLSAVLQQALRAGQVGVWLRGTGDITVQNLSVTTERPKAFVVMEFAEPYTDIHHDVIKIVCGEFGLEAMRADDTFGPGLIIADVTRQIDTATLVIAEITPRNPNVYYELGYAHAKGKPTILLANKSVNSLPFDISPYRTLFYEDSIGGKAKFEEGLRKHIAAILNVPSAPAR